MGCDPGGARDAGNTRRRASGTGGHPGDGALTAIISAFHPIRDRIEATVWLPLLRPVTYERVAQEGRGPADREVLIFNRTDGVVQRFDSGKARPFLSVPDDVFDPLTCFFAYRLMPVRGDDAVRIPVTDGHKLVNGEVRVVGHERVKTPAGTFDTVVIEPELKDIGGIFRKSKNASIRIWLTDDRWRRPVKLESAVAVGHFTAVLKEVRWDEGFGPQNGSGVPSEAERAR